MLDIKREEIKFDLSVGETAAKEEKTFGDARPQLTFKGSRIELRNYLQKHHPDIYEAAFIYTINGKTRDWFNSFSIDFAIDKLKTQGFNWEPTIQVMYLKEINSAAALNVI